MGVFGVWGAAQSYCLDYLKYMSTNKYLLHFIWPFENNIIIHRNKFDFRNWIRNLKRKRFRKSTLDRKTNNCTLSDVIGCFLVILASRSFWQTLVRTLLNFAANGNWDNRKVSWHLEAKSILTRRSGLHNRFPVLCIVRLKTNWKWFTSRTQVLVYFILFRSLKL